jgi:DNA-binding NtrC family response regulator
MTISKNLIKADKLINTLNRAVEMRRLLKENLELSGKNESIIFSHGDSAVIKSLNQEIDRVAKTEAACSSKAK